MNKLSKNIIITVLVIVALSVGFYFIQLPGGEPEEIGIQSFIALVREGQIKKAEVAGSEVTITLNDEKGTKQIFRKELGEPLSDVLSNYGLSIEEINSIEDIFIEKPPSESLFFNLLPILLPLLIFGFLIFLFFKQIQGANSRAMSFGQSGARQVDTSKKNKITFKDVAGLEEAKIELLEIVDFLKHPKKFLALGAKIPRGVLLMGAPGTGKTLLAKAVAGQANVPFFTISGSEFVEMFVGVGASRVRDLFKKAKKNAPCIIFIDEIDAVGRVRGSGMGGSHDEREQTLNQILVEMDGFDSGTNVIVIAATNRPDVLDPALLRPGRFDRQIVLDKPDKKERIAILKIHIKNSPTADDIDLEEVAKRTPGFTGADLANIVNEGAILATRRKKSKVGQDEILESIEKVSLGPERKSHLLTPEEKKLTAYHEGGHALVAHFLEKADPVHKISILSRGRAAGYTMIIPEEDKKMQKKSEFIAELAVMMGGHAAEQLIYGEVTTGPHNDIKRATDLARKMVMSYGMGEKLAPRTYGDQEEMIFLGRELHERRNYSEKVAEDIDEEVSNFIEKALKEARELLQKHRAKLDELVEVLIKKETLEKKEFAELMAA